MRRSIQNNVQQRIAGNRQRIEDQRRPDELEAQAIRLLREQQNAKATEQTK
jgi:hypothetical protein